MSDSILGKRTVVIGQYASGDLIELEVDTAELIREWMGWKK